MLHKIRVMSYSCKSRRDFTIHHPWTERSSYGDGYGLLVVFSSYRACLASRLFLFVCLFTLGVTLGWMDGWMDGWMIGLFLFGFLSLQAAIMVESSLH